MVSWNPNRNLKSENSQDYAEKPRRDCSFMNLASELTFSEGRHVDDPGVVSFELLDQLLCGHIPDEDVLSHPSDGSVLPLQNAGKVMKAWVKRNFFMFLKNSPLGCQNCDPLAKVADLMVPTKL